MIRLAIALTALALMTPAVLAQQAGDAAGRQPIQPADTQQNQPDQPADQQDRAVDRSTPADREPPAEPQPGVDQQQPGAQRTFQDRGAPPAQSNSGRQRGVQRNAGHWWFQQSDGAWLVWDAQARQWRDFSPGMLEQVPSTGMNGSAGVQTYSDGNGYGDSSGYYGTAYDGYYPRARYSGFAPYSYYSSPYYDSYPSYRSSYYSPGFGIGLGFGHGYYGFGHGGHGFGHGGHGFGHGGHGGHHGGHGGHHGGHH